MDSVRFITLSEAADPRLVFLLAAGAKVNAGGDVFRACREFEAENAFRNPTVRVSFDPLTHREATTEPSSRHASPIKPLDSELSPRDTRGLEEIVKLLVVFGANASGLRPTGSDRVIIGDCIWHGNAYTASYLFDGVLKSL